MGFSVSVTGIGFCLPFYSKDEDIPKYVKYPLEVPSEFSTLTERERMIMLLAEIWMPTGKTRLGKTICCILLYMLVMTI